MNKIYKTTILAIVLVVAGLMNKVSAQQDMTLYPMQSVPQSYYTNPALIPDAKINIGCLPIMLPIMPSMFFEVSNNGFNWNNVFKLQANDSLKADAEDMVKHLKKRNDFTQRMSMELLSFGFRIKRTQYVSLSLTEKENFRFCYPGDLLSLAWKGNSQFIGGEADFSGFGVNFLHYRELAVGYSNQIDDRITLGGRFKLLFGMSNLWIKQSDLTLAVDGNTFDLTGNASININTSIPDALYDNIKDAADTTSVNNNKAEFDPGGYITNMSNLGGALDFGIAYKINKMFQVAASVTDLGYIHWKKGVHNYVNPSGTFTFSGVDLTQFVGGDSAKAADAGKRLVDSIGKQFELDQSTNAYWGPLTPTIYLSGFMNLTPKDKISIVARGEIYQHALHPAVMIAATRSFNKRFGVTLSYSYMNRSWLNLGFGAQATVGPLQIFLATDNALAGIIPYKAKTMNIHFGANLIFHYKSYFPLLKQE